LFGEECFIPSIKPIIILLLPVRIVTLSAVRKVQIMDERDKYDQYLRKRIKIDWTSDPRQHDRQMILKSFLSASSDYILDCGCGEKEPLTVCNTPKAVAFDIGASGLKNIKANGFKGHTILGSCTHLPFRSKCFEKSICSEIIEHLPTDRDVKKCIAELKRVSRTFMVTTPNNQFDFRWLEHTHKRFFNTESIRKFLPENTIVTTSNVPQSKDPFMPVLPYFLLNKAGTFIGKWLYAFNFHIVRTPAGKIIKRIKSPLHGKAFIVAVYHDNKSQQIF
jgi:2-polyprenyl-3-methyl-5-hydroxy-6-metoxy-1,4-benzoquinol methylase